MKDLTTYALCHAAVLTAAIAVIGLLATAPDPLPAEASGPQLTVVQADTTHAVATMNIPF